MRKDRFFLASCIAGCVVLGHVWSNGQSINIMRKPQKETASRSSKQESTVVGIYVNGVARDSFSNVWFFGSVWLLHGLLVCIKEPGTSVTTLPDLATVEGLTFTSSNGWVIGDYRSIYSTTDEGRSWQRKLKADVNLTSICFIDAITGWVSGWHGTIYHTDDGGNSWSLQKSGIHHNLSKITFVDHNHGWALGGTASGPSLDWQSALITTEDGGQTWKSVTPPKQLRSLVFANASRGAGLDLKGNIYDTVDGGRTWLLRYKTRGHSLRSLVFLDESSGWAIGEIVLHTTDGGITWSRITREKLEYSLDDVVFVDRANGFGVSQYPIGVFRTTDGGSTWLPFTDDWKIRAIDEAQSLRQRRSSN